MKAKKEAKITANRNRKAEKKAKLLTKKLESFTRTLTTWDKGLTSDEVAIREKKA